ncbi:4Fe-4S dicluster domain-containing protein [Methanoregula sp.]|uniref:4Fe-4S dicluster domain-containing protein n=1 Tax=Methanoregula sp. TaxID=2052170 RepID=UPI003C73EBAB
MKTSIFCVNDDCTSCGTCVDTCPVKNIALMDSRPAWQHHCELCFSCIRRCPVAAIQIIPRAEIFSSV